MKKNLTIFVSVLIFTSQLSGKTMNEKISDFIDMSRAFTNIAQDNTGQITQNLYGHIYKTNNPPSINKAKKALFYIKFNEVAHTKSSTIQGWQRVKNVSTKDGMYAAIFKKYNQVIIAFRGAELGLSDWVTDGQSQNNEIALQYTDALKVARRIDEAYPYADITITGYSLGGALATFTGLLTDKKVYTFNHLALNKHSIEFIEHKLSQEGDSLSHRAHNLIHFHFKGEFVADGDGQQDGDTIFKHQIIGDTYYLDDKRFHAFLFNNRMFRHLFPPLKEELEFLSNPFYRTNSLNGDLENNPVDPWRARFYYDNTWDDYDLYQGLNKYILNSLPSLVQDIITYSK